MRFSHVDYSGRNVDDCDYLLRQDLARDKRTDALPKGRWKLLWEGRRPTDRDERFRLYRNTGAGSTRGATDAIDREKAAAKGSPSARCRAPSAVEPAPAATPSTVADRRDNLPPRKAP